VLQQVKRVVKDSTIYGLGSVLPKAVAFLLIPVYTQFLSPKDYGLLSLVTTISSMAAVIFALGQNGSLSLYFRASETEGEGKEGLGRMLYSVSLFTLIFGAVVMALLTLFGPAATPHLVSNKELTYYPYLSLALWIAYLGVPLTLLQSVNRARGQAGTYTFFQLASFAINTTATLIFVIALRQGAAGSLRGTLIATVALAPIALYLLAREMRFRFSAAWLRKCLVFGLPLIPHFFAGWLLAFSDRYLLQHYSTLTAVGLYSLAYNLSMALMLVTSSINTAWGPIYYDLAATEEGRRTIPRLTTLYVAGVTVFGIGFVSLSRELLLIMSNARFHAAAGVVPIVAAGYYAFALYSVVSTSIFYKKKTLWIPVLSLGAAAINISLNIWLMPRFGMYAAAWTTLIAFALMAIGARVLTGRLMPGSIEDGPLAASIGIFTAAALASAGLDRLGLPLWLGLLLKLGVIALGIAALVPAKVVSAKDIRSAIAAIKDRKKAKPTPEEVAALEVRNFDAEGNLPDDTGRQGPKR